MIWDLSSHLQHLQVSKEMATRQHYGEMPQINYGHAIQFFKNIFIYCIWKPQSQTGLEWAENEH